MNLKPGHCVFAVNSSGRVFVLTKESGAWTELEYLGIEFKRVSAARNVVWAIGGDHQIYVYVYGVEVPIRVKEVTYENERWNPIEGFCANLLPTDRPHFSNKEGTKESSKDKISLPTLAWVWDDDWHLDTIYKGSLLQSGAWTYAVDFPAEYHAKKGLTSCVRRRKWIRHRRYVAVGSWSAVPGIHRDVAEEPFIDVSVGGFELLEGNEDELTVWAVTVAGRLMVRQGVTASSPEGTGWIHIPTPTGKEVSQVSVAGSGLVWAVTWHGCALVRLGVSVLDPTGVSWCEIGAPRPSAPLSLVSVGWSIVWAVARDGSVWFRQGFKSFSSQDSEHLAKGTKWIQMVGEVSMLAVGPGDQVLAITGNQDNRKIQIRTGVTSSDLSGKTWKTVSADCSFQRARKVRCVSTSSQDTHFRVGSCSSTQNSLPSQEKILPEETFHEVAAAADDEVMEPCVSGSGAGNDNTSTMKSCIGEIGEEILMRTEQMAAASIVDVEEKLSESEESKRAEKGPDNCDDGDKTKVTDPDAAAILQPSPIDASMYHSAVDSVEFSRQESESSGKFFFGDDNDLVEEDNAWYHEPQWTWVTMGGCCLEPAGHPKDWFHSAKIASAKPRVEPTAEPWRQDILSKLSAQNQVTANKFKEYDSAIERRSWAKKGHIKFNTGDAGTRFESALLELEQCGSTENTIDFGTISIFGMKTNYKEHISLSEITCISMCNEKTSPQLALYTKGRSVKLQPLLLKFPGEKDMEDWHADIVAGMNAVHGTHGRPSKNSVYSVTNRGEVLVFDPLAAKNIGDEESSVVGSQYSQELDIVGRSLPLIENLQNGFCPGSALYLEVKVKEGCHRFSLNLQNGKAGDSNCDIPLHLNPRFDTSHVVLNHHEQGSWGKEEKHPLVIMLEDGGATRAFAPGKTVQLVIKAGEKSFDIFVNGVKFAAFRYRLRCELVTHFRVIGDVDILKAIYSSNTKIFPPTEMYWRSLGGGHMLQVETCPSGVVWALGYDGTPWVYTGGWGGAHFKGDASSPSGIHGIRDRKYFYIYENQRWNPLTGFSTHGLPTDRYMWSDKSGKYSATKDSIKLPSSLWQWSGDWQVDYYTPGGVDREGWQYATDFPASYHAAQTFTDYVRRRRWARKCELQTTGPWKQLANTKLIDISLQPWTPAADTASASGVLSAWAVATNGEALLRKGVTRDCPEGTAWTHVNSDVLFQGVSVGVDGNVWLVSSDGRIYLRRGISGFNPTGLAWIQLQNPESPTGGAGFRAVTAGKAGLWAIDTAGKLWLRSGITPQYPEGLAWTFVCDHVRCVTSGENGEVWGVVDNLHGVAGVVVRRRGITPARPQGEEWEPCIGGGWKQITIRARTD